MNKEVKKEKISGVAIASLALGVVAIVFVFLGFYLNLRFPPEGTENYARALQGFFYIFICSIGIFLAIPSTVMGGLFLKPAKGTQKDKKSIIIAIIGVVLGALGIVLAIVSMIFIASNIYNPIYPEHYAYSILSGYIFVDGQL
jgi:hypothetical protein